MKKHRKTLLSIFALFLMSFSMIACDNNDNESKVDSEKETIQKDEIEKPIEDEPEPEFEFHR